MPTYIYAEKNGNASITLSADNEEEAYDYLKIIVTHPTAWRLDEETEEDEE